MLARWLNGTPPSNTWFGVSAEDQARWTERVPLLLSIPARLRFVSVEPMVGPIRFTKSRVPAWLQGNLNPLSRLNWIIFGGESGPKRRLFEIDWLEDGVRQCDAARVRVFVKQDSALKPGEQGRIPDELWRRKEWPKGGAR
jgi:protein gp37